MTDENRSTADVRLERVVSLRSDERIAQERVAQAMRVMSEVGPLLDAWDGLSNDEKPDPSGGFCRAIRNLKVAVGEISPPPLYDDAGAIYTAEKIEDIVACLDADACQMLDERDDDLTAANMISAARLIECFDAELTRLRNALAEAN